VANKYRATQFVQVADAQVDESGFLDMQSMDGLPLNSVLLQDRLDGVSKWLLFRDPVEVVKAHCIADVAVGMRAVREHVANGLYAAGFLSYEASSALDGALKTHDAGEFPLLWFALYKDCEVLDGLPQPTQKESMEGEWLPSVTMEQYNEAISHIRARIRDGDTYQVNYTFRLCNTFTGDAWKLFLQLQAAQYADHCAFIRLERFTVCSASPELFFVHEGDTVVCKPMKGTIKRGPTTRQDLERARWLQASEKNRSENVMIVDMIRNDLGTIAKVGSVEVERLFEIEKYPTVHQMTSTVVARTAASPLDVLEKMFPCASITGAPKVKTMEIIADLETQRRDLYTGSIGYVSPRGRSKFNVAIRTVVIDGDTNTATYGVGGGITWDSEAADEYDECKAKAAVLMRDPAVFDLLETMLWDPEQGFYLLDLHLARLSDSAGYFDFDLPMARVRAELDNFKSEGRSRCGARLTLSRDGVVAVRGFDIQPVKGHRVGFARRPTPMPAHVCHKTTDRRAYDLAKSEVTGFHEALLWDADGQVTEATIANVVADIGGNLVTPGVDQGLLPGVFRQHLLNAGVVKEGHLSKSDLLAADALFLVNSVRGWMRLEKDESTPTWRIATEFVYTQPADADSLIREH